MSPIQKNYDRMAHRIRGAKPTSVAEYVMKFVLMLSLCLIVSACGKKSSEGDRNLTILPLGEPLVCGHSYYDGGSYRNLSHQIVTKNFGKEVDMAHINNVASASGQQTVSYIQDVLGVNVRKSTRYAQLEAGCNEAGRNFFDEVIPADTQEMSGWRESDEGTVLGSYFPVEENRTDPGRHLILLHPQTGRYTLIHELMHYLFYHQKDFSNNAIRRMSDEEVKSESKRLIEVLNKTIKLDSAIETVIEFLKYDDEMAVRFPLEEITIERSLLESYINKGLNYITGLSIRSSLGYMYSNIESAQDIYENDISVVDTLNSAYQEQFGTYHTDLNAQKKLLQARLTELAQLKSWADQIKQRLESNMPGLAIRVEELKQTHKGCSHSEETQELINNRPVLNL